MNIWDVLILKKFFIVYLKFKGNWVSCILSGDPSWRPTVRPRLFARSLILSSLSPERGPWLSYIDLTVQMRKRILWEVTWFASCTTAQKKWVGTGTSSLWPPTLLFSGSELTGKEELWLVEPRGIPHHYGQRRQVPARDSALRVEPRHVEQVHLGSCGQHYTGGQGHPRGPCPRFIMNAFAPKWFAITCGMLDGSTNSNNAATTVTMVLWVCTNILGCLWTGVSMCQALW